MAVVAQRAPVSVTGSVRQSASRIGQSIWRTTSTPAIGQAEGAVLDVEAEGAEGVGAFDGGSVARNRSSLFA